MFLKKSKLYHSLDAGKSKKIRGADDIFPERPTVAKGKVADPSNAALFSIVARWEANQPHERVRMHTK